jgi:uncharacterized protein YxjI
MATLFFSFSVEFKYSALTIHLMDVNKMVVLSINLGSSDIKSDTEIVEDIISFIGHRVDTGTGFGWKDFFLDDISDEILKDITNHLDRLKVEYEVKATEKVNRMVRAVHATLQGDPYELQGESGIGEDGNIDDSVYSDSIMQIVAEIFNQQGFIEDTDWRLTGESIGESGNDRDYWIVFIIYNEPKFKELEAKLNTALKAHQSEWWKIAGISDYY